MDLICFMIRGKMAVFMFVWEGWQQCLSPNVEFVNSRQILSNTSICEQNCLQIEAFVSQSITVSIMTISSYPVKVIGGVLDSCDS